MPLYIEQSGDLDRCYRCLTHSHLKDRATQLLIKCKSGALLDHFGPIWTLLYHFRQNLILAQIHFGQEAFCVQTRPCLFFPLIDDHMCPS